VFSKRWTKEHKFPRISESVWGGAGLEGGETVSVIKYVGNANLSYVALSPSETSQKLTYAILLGSSQDSSNHMRIP